MSACKKMKKTLAARAIPIFVRKKCIVLVLLLTYQFHFLAAQAPWEDNLSRKKADAVVTLGHLWGFLKYYHPNVKTGRWNWDSVLIEKIPVFLTNYKKASVNKITLEWINELGYVDSCKNCYSKIPKDVGRDIDFDWMNAETFEPALLERLNHIKQNRGIGYSHYVKYRPNSRLLSFTNEKAYGDSRFEYPDTRYRLLLLFRYWNIVQYFAPYKQLTDEKWNKVLTDGVRRFYNAPNKETYHSEIVQLIASLNDGHANIHEGLLESFLGKYYAPPFLCMRINEEFVVSRILNDSLAKVTDIRKGDVITAVNGKSVNCIYKKLAAYTFGSNSDAKAMTFAELMLFRGNNGKFIVKIRRKEGMLKNVMQLSPDLKIDEPQVAQWYAINDSIGYINMGQLLRADVDSVMQEVHKMKAVIIDLRNYPRNTWDLIARSISDNSFIMSKIAYPDLDYPGIFLFAAPQQYKPIGKKPYRGKIVLLVDETTVSHAEYSTMGLQASTKTVTIGNTTAGKDGDVTERIWLPGGFFTRFSGLGVYYPDGTVTQRVGIKIDIKQRPTINGLRNGVDDVLNAAINYLNKGDANVLD